VGKYELEVATIPPDRPRSIPNTKAAILKELKAQQRRNVRLALPPILVVCEATGGYERMLLELAHELGLEAHRAEGRRVRLFALLTGQRAKTDPLDAAVIASFAQKSDYLIRYVPPSPVEKKLVALIARREELLKMKLAEQSREEHMSDPLIVKSLRTVITMLKKQLKLLETKIASLIRSDAELVRKNNLLQSVIGVGPITAQTLLAKMPELGTLPKGQAAALIGLAPFNRDSGQTNRPRHICAGRFEVRRCLFMAATVAIAKNPVLKRKFQNLRERGKPYKVALIAIMRKMIVILNAILKSDQPWKGAKIA